jgi:hypothetical protein
MSFTRIKPGNWAVNEKLTSAQMNAIDVDHANALDKSVAGDTISGAIAIASTGKIQASAAGALIQTTTGGRIQLGDNDYPTFSATRSISRALPIIIQQGPNFNWTVTNEGSTSNSLGVSGYMDITAALIDGSTLSSVDVYFSVGAAHSGVPIALPLLAVYRRVITAPNPASLGNAVYSPTPSSGAIWTNAGNTNTWNVPCTTNNVIDRSQYCYFVALTDESGANAIVGNVYQALRLNMTAIADMRPA